MRLGIGALVIWGCAMERMKQAGKAVFFDIDGTLINIKNGWTQIRPAVRTEIKRLREAGYRTFIASGRPYAYLDPKIADSKLFDGFVLMNGAAVMMGHAVIYDDPLPKELVQEIVALSEGNGIEYILEGLHDVYLRPEFKATEQFCRDIDVNVRGFVRDYDLAHVDAYKIEFYARDPGGNGVYEHLLKKPELTGLMDPYHKENMELYASSISKGTGICHALDYLGIPRTESYAFGDGLNDMEMMETVGMGLVMENARPQLKEKASHILPSVDEDGVAFGIRRYILGEE